MINDLLDINSASILIVADEKFCLDFLESILINNGFNNLVTFQSTEQAFEFYQTSKPDLVFINLKVTVPSSLDMLKLFQDHAYYPRPPIVIFSEDDSRETKLTFFSSGAMDFIKKPFDEIEIICRVKNFLIMYLNHKESLQHYSSLDELVRKRTADLVNTQKEILNRLGIASEYKDADTYLHTIRVGQYAGHIAKSMGFNNHIIEELMITAPLHDIGKIGVPDNILFKQGKLDASEWELMKSHTIHGQNILKGSSSKLLKSAESIALSHHERWDGLGYPHQLKKTEIHIYSRITAICDVYDALTMDRPYKKAWSHEDAVDKIVEGRGTQFDPELVDIFQTVQREFDAISKGDILISY